MGAKRIIWSGAHPVEPTAGKWRILSLPDPRLLRLPAPPADDSDVTRSELAELITLTHNRTPEDIEQILHWSTNEASPCTHWVAVADELIRLYKVTPPAAARIQSLLNEAIYSSLIAAWANKFVYLRPRPNQLDSMIDVSVIPVPQHPSYPAGHSSVAGAAAKVLKHFFPEEAARFTALAEESGLSRLKAGIHYRSDHTAGLKLGRVVAHRILRRALHDGAPRLELH
jgi:hypothetical protein